MVPAVRAGQGRQAWSCDFQDATLKNIDSVNGCAPMPNACDFFPDEESASIIPLASCHGSWASGDTVTLPAVDGSTWFSSALGTGAQQMYKRTNTSSLYMPITAPGAVSNNYPQTQMDADEGIFIPAKTWSYGATLNIRLLGQVSNTSGAPRAVSFMLEPNGSIWTTANLHTGGGTGRINLEKLTTQLIPDGITANSAIEVLITANNYLKSDLGTPPAFRPGQIWMFKQWINTTDATPLLISGGVVRDSASSPAGFDFWNTNTVLGVRFCIDTFIANARVEFNSMQAWIQKGPWA
jgi:hypothetical protein